MAWTIPGGTVPGTVTLTVTDLDGVGGFYRDTVGLPVQDREDGRMVLGPDRPLIVLREDRDIPDRPREAAGLFHTAVRVPDRGALADVLDRVEAAGALHGASDHGVSEALYLSDPEGNGIEVYRDRDREDWTETGGMVAMPTERLDLDGLRPAAHGHDRVPDGTTVGHVHLEVTDLAASRAFYVDTLGFTVRQELGTALFVAAADYHHHIGMNTWNGRTAPVSGRGLDRFALHVPSRDAVTTLQERCIDAGMPVEPADEGFTVRDPDGITLHIRPAP